jgi:uncharacterized protein (UPF0303 family)
MAGTNRKPTDIAGFREDAITPTLPLQTLTKAKAIRRMRALHSHPALQTKTHSLIPSLYGVSLPMPIAEDLAALAIQEGELLFPAFNYDTAWQLGLTLRELAASRKQTVVIDIRRFGQPYQPLFYTALGGTPDNSRWVQRKSNVVARFHRCSYAVGLTLEQTNRTFADRYNLPDADYAAHGGSFPIHVAGAGIIGSVTVSGLTQREDHNLVVEALCTVLNKPHDSLRLADAS